MYNILSMAELPRSAETLKNPLYDSAVEPPSPGNIYTAQNPLVYRFLSSSSKYVEIGE